MKQHVLKTESKYFSDCLKGVKQFTIRYNDRHFKVGDEIIKQEIKDGKLTGRELTCRITSVIDYPAGLKEGYVVLGLRKLSYTDSTETNDYVFQLDERDKYSKMDKQSIIDELLVLKEQEDYFRDKSIELEWLIDKNAEKTKLQLIPITEIEGYNKIFVNNNELITKTYTYNKRILIKDENVFSEQIKRQVKSVLMEMMLKDFMKLYEEQIQYEVCPTDFNESGWKKVIARLKIIFPKNRDEIMDK